MSSFEYYVIDTETTGLKAGYNEVFEISVIRCSDRAQLTKRIRAEHPERASIQALEITKKTVDDIIQGDSKEDVVDAVNAFFEQDGKTDQQRCIIAHNAPFDQRFCHALWKSAGKEFPCICWLDTKPFAKLWSKKLGIEKPKLTLAAAIEFTGIKPVRGGIHNAGADAQNTYLLWKKGMAEGIDHLSCIKRVAHIIE